MKKLRELLPGIIMLLVLLGLAGVVIYYIGLGIISALEWLNLLLQQISTLDVVLLVALISGTVAVVSLLVNTIVSFKLKSLEYRHKEKYELQKKMEQPYESFINLIYDMLSQTKGKSVMTEKEMLSRMMEFSKQVTLHGSNKVIKKWASYRTTADKLSPAENLKQLEGILFAIRSDLGLKKKGMQQGDILSLFINDAKSAIQNKK